MPEIITLFAGNCGNSVGQQFWETICTEHGIDESGTYVGDNETQLCNINVYFREIKGSTYTPKSVFIDLDRRSVNGVRNSRFGRIFNPDNFVFAGEGATGNNWAKGYFTEGMELCNNALDVIRKDAEGCDRLGEFEMVHSIGGGTGSGFGSLLLSNLGNEYPNKLKTTYSVFPSTNISSCVIEPYNAVLTINYLIECTNKTFCMDNDALYSMVDSLQLNEIDFCGVNKIMSCAMSGITTSTRFPGSSNLGFRKFIVNEIPHPELHFFVSGLGPLLSKDKKTPWCGNVLNNAFDSNNYLAKCDTKKGTFLTANCIIRGKVPIQEVEQRLRNLKNKNRQQFVRWIPDNLKLTFCDIAHPGFNPMAIFIANTTAIQDVLIRLRDKHRKMFRKKMFLHWFIGEGMDNSEFEEAEENLNSLIENYKFYEECTPNPG